MSRTQNLHWKRKALITGIAAVSFAGYAALGSGTVSAGNYGEWDCSENDSYTSSASDDGSCTVTSDGSYDSVPDDTIPDSVPEDSVPVTDPKPTVTTQPPSVYPPAPVSAPIAAAPVVVPAQAAPQTIATTPSLPATGRGSALPTAFIAIGLLGAGSVALAFARRNSAARSTSES